MTSDAIKVIKKSVHNYRYLKTTFIRENTFLCLFYFKRKFICSREKLKNASWTLKMWAIDAVFKFLNES